MTNEERLVSFHFPYLPIRVNAPGINFEGSALVDTGLEGGVVLPLSYLPANVPPERHTRWVFADGSRRGAPIYSGSVTIGDFPTLLYPISITIMGDEPIIGVEVIRHFSVILDHGRRVIVEP